jgi:hypothetical protein
MLTNYSKKRLSSLFEQSDSTSYAFSDRLASCFKPEAALSPSELCPSQTLNALPKIPLMLEQLFSGLSYIPEGNDDLASLNTNPPIIQHLKPRKKRFFEFNKPYNTTQASQDTSGLALEDIL